jgi:hypothetical protein
MACYSEAVQCNSYSERVNKDVLGSSNGGMVVSDEVDNVQKAANSEQINSANGGDGLILSDHAEVLNAQSEAKSSISVGRYGSRLNVSSERSSCRCGHRKHTDTQLTRQDVISPKGMISHIKVRKIQTDRTTRLLIAILCLFLVSEFLQVSYVGGCQSTIILPSCKKKYQNGLECQKYFFELLIIFD